MSTAISPAPPSRKGRSFFAKVMFGMWSSYHHHRVPGRPVTHPLFKQAVLVSYKTVSDLVSKTAFFVILILAAHTLPTRTFGLFSLASTLGWVLSVATDFGLQLHLARLVSRAPDRTAVILRPMLRVRIAL